VSGKVWRKKKWSRPVPTYLEQLEKDLGEVLAVLLFEVEELTDALRQGHASGPAYFAVFPEGDEGLEQRGADLDCKLPVVLRADDLKCTRFSEGHHIMVSICFHMTPREERPNTLALRRPITRSTTRSRFRRTDSRPNASGCEVSRLIPVNTFGGEYRHQANIGSVHTH
jgi:hypothetical protein